MLLHSTLMLFTAQESQFFFTMDVELHVLVCTKCIFSCLISTMKQTGNGVAHKGRLSLLFPRCFTMLPSEGKRTIARALKKPSVRPCDEFVIGTRWKSWIDALVQGGQNTP
jgi:hypothetical protein